MSLRSRRLHGKAANNEDHDLLVHGKIDHIFDRICRRLFRRASHESMFDYRLA